MKIRSTLFLIFFLGLFCAESFSTEHGLRSLVEISAKEKKSLEDIINKISANEPVKKISTFYYGAPFSLMGIKVEYDDEIIDNYIIKKFINIYKSGDIIPSSVKIYNHDWVTTRSKPEKRIERIFPIKETKIFLSLDDNISYKTAEFILSSFHTRKLNYSNHIPKYLLLELKKMKILDIKSLRFREDRNIYEIVTKGGSGSSGILTGMVVELEIENGLINILDHCCPK